MSTAPASSLQPVGTEHEAMKGSSHFSVVDKLLIQVSSVSRYLVVTSDVLTSVKKMEESLRRLRTARGTSSAGGSQGMSDDDKIRLQLCLDVKELRTQVQWFVAISVSVWSSDNFHSYISCSSLCWCFLFVFLLFSYLRFLLPVTYFVNLRLIVSHFDSRHSNTGFTLSLFTVGSSWFLSEFPATGVRCCLAFATLQ